MRFANTQANCHKRKTERISTLRFIRVLSVPLALHSRHPTVLVRRGKLLPRTLGHERIAPDEIFSAMHKAGIERIEDVAWAILEADGKIAIIPASASVGP